MQYDIRLHTGDNAQIQINFVDQDGQAVDVLRATITLRVAPTPHETALITKSSPEDFTVDLSSVEIPLVPGETALFGTYFFEVLAEDLFGHLVTGATGYLTFSPRVVASRVQITGVLDTNIFQPVYVLDFRNPRNSALLMLLFDEVL